MGSTAVSSRLARLARTAFGRVLGLPPPVCEFDIHKSVRVPMRDGVDLIADHYAPQTADPAGTLLVRGPYGRGYPFSALFGSVYAARGYHVVIQSVRGTFGSGGHFDPFVNEVDDGVDTAAWLRNQPWFTGTFATMGLSYLGFTQWALLTDPPAELKAAVITVGFDDVSGPRWGRGSFGLNDFLGWSDLVGRQEDASRLRTLLRQARAQQRVTKTSLELPLGAASRELLGDGAPWFESWLDHPDTDDPFWSKLNLRDLLDRTEVPVLLLSGWQDLFVEQTLEHYRMLTDRGVPTGMTVGPWTHGDMMTRAAPTVLHESLDWLATHLGGAEPQRRRPVRVHLAGHGWMEMTTWPPAMPTQVLHPQPDGGLAPAVPEPDSAAFVYNPADPTPTVGGRLLSPAGGYRDDSELARRADVLTFTSTPLAADLYVVGSPEIEIEHTCANPHNDLFVRISQVDSAGKSRNISDGYLASAPDNGVVRIALDPVAWTFPAGSRIRVLIAGGSHPRFLRNLGTGEPVATATTVRTARHTVHFGGSTRLMLPAGPRPPSAD